MAKRILWDLNEAVILLDALIAVQEGRMTRNEAIISVSSELRARAVKNGMEIDEIFRNINGISLQMSVMEYILTEGRRGIGRRGTKKPSMPKVFQTAVDLYRNNREAYEKALKEARDMPDAKSIQDLYFAWLASQVSSAQLSELYVAYADIEDFCLSHKIITKKLFTLTNLVDIRRVISTVESNRIFRSTYTRSLEKISSAMRFYDQFLKENPELLIHSNSAPEKAESSNSVTVPIKSDPGQTDKIVDFYTDESVAFTQPTEFSYFGEQQAKVNSWAQLYVQVVACLLEDYPDILRSYLNNSIDGQKRCDFADETSVGTMIAPKRVENHFYLETSISPTAILKKIKRLLDLCNIDYENLIIRYQKKERITGNHIAAQQTENDEIEKENISQNRIQFIEWMRRGGDNIAVVFNYLSAIKQLGKAASEYGICDTNLLLIQDINQLEEIKTSLLALPNFQRRCTPQQYQQFETTLTKLIEFRAAKFVPLSQVSQAQSTIEPEKPQEIREAENAEVPAIITEITEKAAEKLEEPEKTSQTPSEEPYARYTEILSEYFQEDGYQLGRAIFRGRFKYIYR